VTPSTCDRILDALAALARDGWSVGRSRADLLDIADDAFPLVALDHDSLDEICDAKGELQREARFVRNGPAPDLQIAFARQGLQVAVGPDEQEDFAVSPELAPLRSDLMDLLDAFDALEAEGYATGAGIGDTPTDAWEELRERAGDDPPAAVLWTREAHRAAFDRSGALEGGLAIGWRGDRQVIHDKLAAALFPVADPENDDDTFLVGSP
jgi:hypothetical protein